MLFGYVTLLVAFVLSAVAAYYSVLGLTAIFSAAFWPVVIMGSALEVGKIITAMWLHKNWMRSTWVYKAYLLLSLIFLMVLTSMGTFGFLSRAHSDQGLNTGDAQAQLAVLDEKIKTERENIDAAKRALNQLDQTVEQTISRSQAEDGVARAASLRRSQQKERQELQRDIANAQSNIARLNEQRAPIAAAYRKIEAEVGPIKYVAALIYGENADQSLLESAVRWVIILIVAVFDPLAVVLILAGTKHIEWSRQERRTAATIEDTPEQKLPESTVHTGPHVRTNAIELQSTSVNSSPVFYHSGTGQPEPEEQHDDQFDLSKHPYLVTQTTHAVPGAGPMLPSVYKASSAEDPGIDAVAATEPPVEIQELRDNSYKKITDDYYEINGKMMHIRVIKDLLPDVYQLIQAEVVDQSLRPLADNQEPPSNPVKATFGIDFPSNPERGEMFLQVSTLPSKLFKYNGVKWISVDKNTTDAYNYDDEYLKFLVEQLARGIITPDELTAKEQEQVTEYLKHHEQ